MARRTRKHKKGTVTQPGTSLVRLSSRQAGLVPVDDRSAALPHGDRALAVSGPLSVTRARAASAGRRVNQELIDRMADLRRKGFTFRAIAARLGCSERTARRYAGRVRPQVELPGQQGGPRDLRTQMIDDFARVMHKMWSKTPSVAFVDEAIRQYAERLAGMRAETVRLLAEDHQMRLQLLTEVLGPLYGDYNLFESLEKVRSQFPNYVPGFWRPAGAWYDQSADDELKD